MENGVSRVARTLNFAEFSCKEILDVVKKIDRADVVIIGMSYEGVVSRTGMKYAPIAIRKSLREMEMFVDEAFIPNILNVVDCGTLGFISANDCAELCMESIFHNISSRGFIPITLGGSHSLTNPVIKGLLKSKTNHPVGLVFFDAHMDSSDESLEDSLLRFSHGNVLRRITTIPGIDKSNIVVVGARECSETEWSFIQNCNICVIPMDQLALNFTQVYDDILKFLSDNIERVYISIDMDVVDPVFAPGVSSRSTGGMSSQQIILLIKKICETIDLLGVDIVEIVPNSDFLDLTTSLAAKLLVRILESLRKRRSDFSVKHFIKMKKSSRSQSLSLSSKFGGKLI